MGEITQWASGFPQQRLDGEAIVSGDSCQGNNNKDAGWNRGEAGPLPCLAPAPPGKVLSFLSKAQ